MKRYIRSAEGLTSKQRIKIAKNSTDPKELGRLAYDNSKLVRIAVLENYNTARKVVEMLCQELAGDEDGDVRQAVARKTDDPKLLAMLAEDESWNVRQAVAENAASLKKTSGPRKPAQTDWSVPLYSISNYSEIEDEIAQVIKTAADSFARQYMGESAVVNVPAGVFDNDGTITIDIGDSSYEIDADDILGPATSRNKKKDCVKALISWMGNNLK